MSTFITTLQAAGDGPRLAVKDLIDVEGVSTTAGCRAVELSATPADADASCMAGARAAGARIVGKTNLHELAMLPIGTNPWFGTPTNPLDPTLIPGGSSSGSAVAVADDDADVAYGSDTGGSVRIPAACCGVSGLKTTYGRISLEGVWPLAPSLDTIGPLARDIAGVVLGMQLLEPGFTPASAPATRVGRLRTSADPAIEAAIDEALRTAGFDVVDIELDMSLGSNAFLSVYAREIIAVDGELAATHPDDVGDDIKQMLGLAEALLPGFPDSASIVDSWKNAVADAFRDVQLLALPTLPILPPSLEQVAADGEALSIALSSHTSPFNAAGVPATAQPVPLPGSHIPASLQLVGPAGADELLVATAAVIEAAVR